MKDLQKTTPLSCAASGAVGRGPFTPQVIEQVVARFTAALNPERIILFGSAATGDPGNARDLDILVVMHTDTPAFERRGLVVDILWDMGVDVDVRIYTPEEYAYCEQAGDVFIQDVIATGQVLFDKSAA